MAPLDPDRTALIVIDMQVGFDEMATAGVPRNNPGAEQAVAALLSAFRAAEAPIFHVRHASAEPDSRFRPDRPGYAAMAIAAEQPGEAVVVKSVNSAFIGTDLETRLRNTGVRSLVLCGATTNHCVETTTRMAGNLGFDAMLVRDATWTFDRVGPDGDLFAAADVHRMTLANLAGEFARIVTSESVCAALAAQDRVSSGAMR